MHSSAMPPGKFDGHFYPGLYIFLHGLYQATVVSKAMIFNDTLVYPSCLPKWRPRWARLWSIPYGGWLKIVTGSILAFYVVFCLDDTMVLMNKETLPRFMYPQEWQHLTMFILLTLIGCADVVSKSVLPQRCEGLERGAIALGFYELLLLLASHVQVSSKIELHVHSLLILVVFLLTLVMRAELWPSRTLHLQLIHIFLVLIMGSWLMQAGFILFRPISGYPWEDDDMGDIMFVTTFFCWHAMANALCLLGIYSFSFFWHRRCKPSWRLTGSKEAPCCESAPGPLYRLLQEAEPLQREDQAPFLSQD